jgi:hypothetical protein
MEILKLPLMIAVVTFAVYVQVRSSDIIPTKIEKADRQISPINSMDTVSFNDSTRFDQSEILRP